MPVIERMPMTTLKPLSLLALGAHSAPAQIYQVAAKHLIAMPGPTETAASIRMAAGV